MFIFICVTSPEEDRNFSRDLQIHFWLGFVWEVDTRQVMGLVRQSQHLCNSEFILLSYRHCLYQRLTTRVFLVSHFVFHACFFPCFCHLSKVSKVFGLQMVCPTFLRISFRFGGYDRRCLSSVRLISGGQDFGLLLLQSAADDFKKQKRLNVFCRISQIRLYLYSRVSVTRWYAIRYNSLAPLVADTRRLWCLQVNLTNLHVVRLV